MEDRAACIRTAGLGLEFLVCSPRPPSPSRHCGLVGRPRQGAALLCQFVLLHRDATALRLEFDDVHLGDLGLFFSRPPATVW